LGLPRDFIEKSGGLQRLSRMLAEDLVDKIHDEGGLAILPHPFYFVPSGLSRDLWDMVDAVESFNQTCHIFVEPVMLEFANHAEGEIPLLDDIMSIQLIFGYFSWRNRVELFRHPRPEVGSSDAHIEPFVGSGCTMFDRPVRDLEDLRKQLAANNGVPMLNPRWELHHDLDEIIERVYDHWGKIIINKIREIHNEKRALLPFLKLTTGLLHRVKAKNPLYKPAV
ncbi:hypothetical protein GF325_17580, partial [Candidatus Bathyarchaeota archaeon]|nr:hypothetical protein [Candidatus Bathyarchaeota archaeon]